jgi:DNA polymerase-4
LSERARLRLVGVRTSGLRPADGHATQLAFGDRPVGWREAERTLDAIARRFGDGAVRPANLVPPDRGPRAGGVADEGGVTGPDPESGMEGESAPSTRRRKTRILGDEPGM